MLRWAAGLILLVVLGGCLGGPGVDEEARRQAAEVAALQARLSSQAAAQGAQGAAALTEVARRRAEGIKAQVPTPAWSRFPGLEGPRVRSPIALTPSGQPGPVLLVMMDTTRADHLSAYGYRRQTSPNLELLAREGVRFTRFYGNGAWTRPSVTSMMTSRYRSQHGVEVIPGRLSQEMLTVAEQFKAAGYATAAFVGNQTVRGHYGFDQGFDHYEDVFEELAHDPPAHEVIERALRWLEANDNPRWFVWIFLVDPHDPYRPARAFDVWRRESRYQGKVRTPRIEYLEPVYSRRVLDRMVSLYDAEILEMDDAIGRLVGWLRRKRLWDDLSVVAVGDHGESFGEHNCFLHAYHFWEPNLNIPLIIRSPLLARGAGRIEDRLFEGVDITPTLLTLGGIEAADDQWRPEGVSIPEVLAGPITEGWQRSVFTEMFGYGVRRDMVRRGDYKYVRRLPTYIRLFKHVWPKKYRHMPSATNAITQEFLYNVAEDPGEERNLAGERPELLEAMRRELKAFKAHRGAPDEDESEQGPSQADDDFQYIDEIDPRELEDLRSLGYIE